MSISAACSGCGKIYKLEERFIGKRAKCKACGEEFVVKTAPLPLSAPVAARSSPSKPSPKPPADLADGEFDFSNLDDIENSGTTDESYRPPALTDAPAVDRSRGTPAPAHLRQNPTAAPDVDKNMVPKVIAFIIAGLVVTAVTFFIIHKMLNGDSSTVATSTPKPKPGDGTGLTVKKLIENAEARKQADRDAIPPAQIAPLALPVRTTFPELGDIQNDGFHNRYLIALNGEFLGEPTNLVLYVPEGNHAAHSLRCIMMAPQMGSALEGNTSTEEDIKNAGPFIDAGFAVMLYDTSSYSYNNRPRTPGFCVIEYAQSDGGMHFARNAMNLMAAKAPMIDMSHVYAVGSGTSATAALNLAAYDPRIRAVATVAPVCDLAGHLGAPVADLEKMNKVAGIGDMIAKLSPLNHAAKIQCPVLLLNSTDAAAQSTKADGVAAFAKAMETAGKVAMIETIKPEPEKQFFREVAAPHIVQWLKSH